MKLLFLIPGLLFTVSVSADVWKKPPYIPDENHIPAEEIQREQAQERQEARARKAKVKKTQKNKKKTSTPTSGV